MKSLELIHNKIVRAEEHQYALCLELVEYFKSNPGKIVRQPQGSPDKYVGRVETKIPIPVRVPYIVGDCLQNTRSALDYLVRELVLIANNKPTDHEMFPICDTAKGFKEAVMRGQLDSIPAAASKLIEKLQPYHLGQDWEKASLRVLNDLCNVNKHRRIILTVLRGGNTSLTLTEINGELWGYGRIPRLDENTNIGPFPINQEQQVNVNSQVFMCVTFDEEAVKGMEITSALARLILEIRTNVIPRFTPFFS